MRLGCWAFLCGPPCVAKADTQPMATMALRIADAPRVVRKIWLFALVVGQGGFLWGRFCSGQV